MAIGNGLTDPVNKFVYGQYFYEIGLIDEEQATTFKAKEMQDLSQMYNKQWLQAVTSFRNINEQFLRWSGNISEYNYLKHR